MQQIGYASHHENESKASIIGKDDVILSFDSKNGIDAKDINHHLLVLGTTGTGKTASIILPSLKSLLKIGHCGLIIDVKGNLRGQVRALAKSIGRSADLIEYGSAATATPLNLLNNLDISEVYNTFKTLTYNSFSDASNTKDFHVKGIRQATECFHLLRILEQHDFIEGATIAMVAKLLGNPRKASELYEVFKDKIYDSENKKDQDFTSEIDSNAFHIFKYKEKAKSGSSTNTYIEQLNYAIEGIRTSFKEFLEVPGIAHGFAKSGAAGLDMLEMLKQNKIVLLHFEPGSGPIGVSLARRLIEEYYKNIYTLGVEETANHPSFICIDEFQDVAVLDSSRFSDIAFISQAREFNARFIASTQSVSALACRGSNYSSVDAFVSNCNTKIIFYSDDPRTQEIIERYKFPLSLIDLEAGTAFVAQYNNNIKKHSQAMESFKDCFEETQNIIAKYSKKIVIKKNKPLTNETESIADLIIRIQKNEKLRTKAKKNTAIDYTSTLAKKTNSTPISLIDAIKKDIKMEKTSKGQKSAIALQNKYKDYFIEHGIPIGWYASLAKAIDFIAYTKVPLDISSFAICQHSLQGCLPRRTRSLQDSILMAVNEILKETKDICPLCGEHFEDENYIQMVKDNNSMLLCHNCADKFGIKPYTPEKLDADADADDK